MIWLEDREKIIREYSEKFFKMEMPFEVKFLVNNFSQNAMSLIIPTANLTKSQEEERKKDYDEAIRNLELIEKELWNQEFIIKRKELYKSWNFWTQAMLNLLNK